MLVGVLVATVFTPGNVGLAIADVGVGGLEGDSRLQAERTKSKADVISSEILTLNMQAL